MKVIVTENDTKIVAALDGELDTASVPKVEKDLQPLFNARNKELLIDCSSLRYISSSGLRLFLSLLKSAKANGSTLRLEGLKEEILKVFKMTGFDKLFSL